MKYLILLGLLVTACSEYGTDPPRDHTMVKSDTICTLPSNPSQYCIVYTTKVYDNGIHGRFTHTDTTIILK